jgi:hypothetical protein
MKRRPRFWQGVVVAAVMAVVASVLITSLGAVLSMTVVIRLATPLLALAYLLYLFHGTRARTGRVITLTAWGAMALLCWWLPTPLPLYLLIHAGAIWLIRSLYAYSGLIPALCDAALSAFAILAFSWAFMRTGSVFLAAWCFFLVQSLWIFIPRTIAGPARTATPERSTDQFERARRQADAALRQLFSQ